jgi:TonB-dependent starch-binding outer membrane protein SusC
MKKKYSHDPFTSKTGFKNLLLIMRLSIVLSLLCTVAISANSFSQKKNFSMNLENAKVKDVFQSIEGQSNYRFFYNDELSDINRVVSMDVKNSKIEDILNELFSNTDISYIILDNNLIVIAPKKVALQQKVSGTVTDASTGETLIGVSVQVVGTTVGAITDLDGKFSIDAPKGAVLSFSIIGYVTENVTPSGPTVDVKLVSDVKKLEEVVVVGYGVQRKEAVTGSVASMKGDVLRDVPASNISTALQGRVAGVDMEQTSSQPGATMQIRIRGTRSLNATNDPLVVLDGIPFAGSIGDINPSDIKSIDILKDASATAIYGSRGANGVILVTTIKGKKNQKAQVTYNGYYGVKDIFAKVPMMNGPQFVALRKAAASYKNTADEADTINTDWQDLLYKTGYVTSHNLGISGGTEKGNYMFSGTYYRDEAVIPLQNFTRYSIRFSVDQEVGKYLLFGISSNNNYSITNGANLGAGSAISQSPIANPYNADGTFKTTVAQATQGPVWVYTRGTLEALGDKYIDETRAFGTYNSMYGEVKIPGVDGLKYRINLGLNYRQSNYGNYTGQGVFSGSSTTVSSATVRNENTINYAVENLLTYDRSFGKHKINAVALYSCEQKKYTKQTIKATDIPSDAFQFYNLGRANGQITIDPGTDSNGIPYQDYQLSGLMSYMGRVMYSFNDRYMLSATVRSDGSSVLATGHKWHTYPAVSAAWNIKEESFMKDLVLIDMLKLRAGYGETSNQAINPYQTLGLLSTKGYNYSSTYSTGMYVSKLPNPNLGWEFSKTINVGIDFALLKNRLSGTFEVYEMNTDNVLLNVSLPATSGVSSVMANIGKTQNRGIELSLNGIILSNLNGFTWEAGFNIYVNRNKLKELASGATQDVTNNWFVGHPINVIYDYKKVGLWQEGDAYMSILEPGTGTAPGMIKVNYNGPRLDDGTPTRAISTDDREIMDADPKFQGGFNTRLAYKGFELSVVGAFKNGGILNSTLYGASGYLNNLNTRNGNNVNVDYWTPTNTGAKYPKPGGRMSSDNPIYGSTLGYFSASYLKIRTITLGYTFNKNWNWIKGAGIENLRLYCTVQNPFVFFSPYHDESGMDPETNSYGDENVAVKGSHSQLIIGTNTPATRNFLFGINLSF